MYEQEKLNHVINACGDFKAVCCLVMGTEPSGNHSNAVRLRYKDVPITEENSKEIYRAVILGFAKDAVEHLECKSCGGTGVMEGDPSAAEGSILREDVPCPECRPDA